MDIATIVGLIAAITCLMVGIGPHLSSVIDAPALIIVVGGTLATALISNPLQDVVNLVGICLRAIFVRVPVPTELIERIVAFAEIARCEGFLVVERRLTPDDDPFLAQGLRLAVDGQEPDLITDILKTDLQFIEERHAHAQRMVGFLGVSALVLGGIGATLAITLRLGPEAAGLAVASTAALPLTYGLVIFGVIAEPFRRKLRTYGEKESLTKRMIIEGIMSILSNDHPRIVEHKLSVFLAPKFRPMDLQAYQPARAEPKPADEAFVAEVRSHGVEQQARVVRAVREAVERSDTEPEEKARVTEVLEQVTQKELPTMTILARLSHELREEAIQALAKPPTPLVQQVAESGILTFEDLRQLTEREIQVLLREVDQRDLAFALMGASQEMRYMLLGNMSGRVRTSIEKEIGNLGTLRAGLRAEEVFAVQARIVSQVRQLGWFLKAYPGQVYPYGQPVVDSLLSEMTWPRPEPVACPSGNSV